MSKSARSIPVFVLLTAAVLVAAAPAGAQYREYYLTGKVLDTQKNPIEGAEIGLRDVKTSRGYSMKTNKKGEFKFAGLPHGTYAVTVTKEGYAVKTDEWRFDTPQDTMLKVEIPALTLVSQTQVEEIQKLKEAESEVKDAAELIRKADMDGAIATLKGLLDRNPKETNALYLIGIAYARKSMFPEAHAAFRQVTELAPKFAAAFYQLGGVSQAMDRPEEALEAYARAVALDPANADAFYNSGLVLFKMNRIDESLASFERALVLRPDDPASVEMAGRCYINKAEFEKAVEYLEKAKTLYNDPERAKFLDDLIGQLKLQIKK
jgi:tetratricopeptide (TPR) repeat protein